MNWGADESVMWGDGRDSGAAGGDSDSRRKRKINQGFGACG